MNLQTYQEATKRTLPELGSDSLNISHMIMGMNSEFSELFQATDDVNRGEEITDIMWYISNWCNMRNIDMWRVFEFIPNGYYDIQVEDDYIVQLEVAVSELTDLEKKLLAYKRPVTREKFLDAIVKVLTRANDCYAYYNLNPFTCLKNNIEKLKVRFPDKFTEEYANNRNTDKERKELEKI